MSRTLELLSAEERALVLGPLAGKSVPYPRDSNLVAELLSVASQNADRPAIEDDRGTLSYEALVAAAAGVARTLLDAGVTPGQRVGVACPRGRAQIIAVLGVLRAGCAYVPIDTDHPAARVRDLVTQAELAGVVADSARAEWAGPEIEWLRVDDDGRATGVAPQSTDGDARFPGDEVGPEHAACIMFTSGSTGRPKAVEVPHRAVLRLVLNVDYVALDADTRVLGFSPLTFDASTFEIWAPLLHGGCLVLAPAGPISLGALTEWVRDRKVTTLWLTAALFEEVVTYHLDRLDGVRQLLAGGDRLSPSHARRVLDRHPDLRLVNGYGPTENTTFTACHVVARDQDASLPVPIGRPVPNTYVFVLDEEGRLVPPGMVGELWTGGDGLALGYLDPGETSAAFVEAPFAHEGGDRLYRTGDLVRFRPDGALDFVGRVDAQMKIRGYRIDPAEVERALTDLDEVAMALVCGVGTGTNRTLRAGVVLKPGRDITGAELRERLKGRLPAYMVPSDVLVLERIPVTENGKPDRAALAALQTPAAESHSPAEASTEITPKGAAELVSAVWADLLPGRSFGPDDAFFDVGGDSLLVLRMVEELRVRGGVELPAVRVFEYPTVNGLARYLSERGQSRPRDASARSREVGGGRPRRGGDGVAIVGMSGRFPGAPDVGALWTLLEEGREGVTRFERSELEVPDALAEHADYVPVRGVLDDVEGFDAAFFGVNPKVADIMDPQQRLLLEAGWAAFEDAGWVPGEVSFPVGVFTGVSRSSYLEENLLTRPDVAEQLGALAVQFASEKDFTAAHLAHRLDLRGPAVNVQAASSTSLAAVVMAVQAIRTGMCEAALAGGATVTCPVRSGHLHAPGAMFSNDGSTRTFDAAASGTVFSDGVAMVLLKSLEAAVEDGDRILAMIRGVGLSNDGAPRASFSAPTVEGQAAAIEAALEDAGWSAEEISYVEAHGTGTPLGDPIEIEALTRAYRASTDRRRFCMIGSLKTNIGHLTAAAGVAGLIKTVLAMKHRTIPKILHFESANPAIDFEASPFVVARETVPWDVEGGTRRAGVSSFGAGGSNVHVVVEEWVDEPVLPSAAGGPVPLVLSARTDAALGRQASGLAEVITKTDTPLPWVARTLHDGRKVFERRASVAAATAGEAAAALVRLAAAIEDGSGPTVGAESAPPAVVFLFPGQGAQYPGMAGELYRAAPPFARAVDECLSVIESSAGSVGEVDAAELRRLLLVDSDQVTPHDEEALRDTRLAQPALFILEYALANSLRSWGVEPSAMIGHSLGELVGACVAGVWSLPDALRVVVARGALMAAMPTGAMLSVRSSAEELAPYLDGDVVLAGFNAPKLVVVSGPTSAIDALEERLAAADIACQRLRTSHAFHSSMMGAAGKQFSAFLADVPARAPTIPLLSCATGEALTPGDATDPSYWGSQIRQPVRFAQGLAHMAPEGRTVFLEVGPRRTLSTLARQVLPNAARTFVPVMEPGEAGQGPAHALAGAVGALWSHGVRTLDWNEVVPATGWRTVSLPTYPFERQRHWVEPGGGRVRTTSEAGGLDVAKLVEEQLEIMHAQLDALEHGRRKV